MMTSSQRRAASEMSSKAAVAFPTPPSITVMLKPWADTWT